MLAEEPVSVRDWETTKRGRYCWSNETREWQCQSKQGRVHGRVYKVVGLAKASQALLNLTLGSGRLQQI